MQRNYLKQSVSKEEASVCIDKEADMFIGGGDSSLKEKCARYS